MTTIATDGKTMAGDGQTVDGGTIIATTCPKVRLLEDGSIFGACGPVGDGDLLLEWLANKGKKPRLGESFRAVVIAPNRPARVYFYDCTFEDIDGVVAIGSGTDFALAAMDMGASPERAVEIAAGRDVNTGGTITVLSL